MHYTAPTDETLAKSFPSVKRISFTLRKNQEQAKERVEKAIYRGQAKNLKEDQMKFKTFLRVLQKETFNFPAPLSSFLENLQKVWSTRSSHVTYHMLQSPDLWKEIVGPEHPYFHYGAGPILAREVPNSKDDKAPFMTQPHYLRDWWKDQLGGAQ